MNTDRFPLFFLFICVHPCSSVAISWSKTMTDEELNRLTERIIGCAFKASNTLGCGFLEKVYENALMHELRKSGLRAVAQQPINVFYDGVLVGDYFADIVVEDAIILELKAT